jgi:hypothetical protein
MKQLISIIIIFILFSFCRNENNYLQSKNDNKIINLPTSLHSTLDSLQGKWCLDSACNFGININGRLLEKYELDSNILVYHESFKIYFSDTIVNRYLEDEYNNIKIDTALTSGNFLVTISNNDSSVLCYHFNGFYFDGADTTFSMSNVWANRKPSLYKRKH